MNQNDYDDEDEMNADRVFGGPDSPSRRREGGEGEGPRPEKKREGTDRSFSEAVGDFFSRVSKWRALRVPPEPLVQNGKLAPYPLKVLLGFSTIEDLAYDDASMTSAVDVRITRADIWPALRKLDVEGLTENAAALASARERVHPGVVVFEEMRRRKILSESERKEVIDQYKRTINARGNRQGAEDPDFPTPPPPPPPSTGSGEDVVTTTTSTTTSKQTTTSTTSATSARPSTSGNEGYSGTLPLRYRWLKTLNDGLGRDRSAKAGAIHSSGEDYVVLKDFFVGRSGFYDFDEPGSATGEGGTEDEDGAEDADDFDDLFSLSERDFHPASKTTLVTNNEPVSLDCTYQLQLMHVDPVFFFGKDTSPRKYQEMISKGNFSVGKWIPICTYDLVVKHKELHSSSFEQNSDYLTVKARAVGCRVLTRSQCEEALIRRVETRTFFRSNGSTEQLFYSVMWSVYKKNPRNKAWFLSELSKRLFSRREESDERIPSSLSAYIESLGRTFVTQNEEESDVEEPARGSATTTTTTIPISVEFKRWPGAKEGKAPSAKMRPYQNSEEDPFDADYMKISDVYENFYLDGFSDRVYDLRDEASKALRVIRAKGGLRIDNDIAFTKKIKEIAAHLKAVHFPATSAPSYVAYPQTNNLPKARPKSNYTTEPILNVAAKLTNVLLREAIASAKRAKDGPSGRDDFFEDEEEEEEEESDAYRSPSSVYKGATDSELEDMRKNQKRDVPIERGGDTRGKNDPRGGKDTSRRRSKPEEFPSLKTITGGRDDDYLEKEDVEMILVSILYSMPSLFEDVLKRRDDGRRIASDVLDFLVMTFGVVDLDERAISPQRDLFSQQGIWEENRRLDEFAVIHPEDDVDEKFVDSFYENAKRDFAREFRTKTLALEDLRKGYETIKLAEEKRRLRDAAYSNIGRGGGKKETLDRMRRVPQLTMEEEAILPFGIFSLRNAETTFLSLEKNESGGYEAVTIYAFAVNLPIIEPWAIIIGKERVMLSPENFVTTDNAYIGKGTRGTFRESISKITSTPSFSLDPDFHKGGRRRTHFHPEVVLPGMEEVMYAYLGSEARDQTKKPAWIWCRADPLDNGPSSWTEGDLRSPSKGLDLRRNFVSVYDLILDPFDEEDGNVYELWLVSDLPLPTSIEGVTVVPKRLVTRVKVSTLKAATSTLRMAPFSGRETTSIFDTRSFLDPSSEANASFASPTGFFDVKTRKTVAPPSKIPLTVTDEYYDSNSEYRGKRLLDSEPFDARAPHSVEVFVPNDYAAAGAFVSEGSSSQKMWSAIKMNYAGFPQNPYLRGYSRDEIGTKALGVRYKRSNPDLSSPLSLKKTYLYSDEDGERSVLLVPKFYEDTKKALKSLYELIDGTTVGGKGASLPVETITSQMIRNLATAKETLVDSGFVESARTYDKKDDGSVLASYVEGPPNPFLKSFSEELKEREKTSRRNLGKKVALRKDSTLVGEGNDSPDAGEPLADADDFPTPEMESFPRTISGRRVVQVALTSIFEKISETADPLGAFPLYGTLSNVDEASSQENEEDAKEKKGFGATLDVKKALLMSGILQSTEYRRLTEVTRFADPTTFFDDENESKSVKSTKKFLEFVVNTEAPQLRRAFDYWIVSKWYPPKIPRDEEPGAPTKTRRRRLFLDAFICAFERDLYVALLRLFEKNFALWWNMFVKEFLRKEAREATKEYAVEEAPEEEDEDLPAEDYAGSDDGFYTGMDDDDDWSSSDDEGPGESAPPGAKKEPVTKKEPDPFSPAAKASNDIKPQEKPAFDSKGGNLIEPSGNSSNPLEATKKEPTTPPNEPSVLPRSGSGLFFRPPPPPLGPSPQIPQQPPPPQPPSTPQPTQPPLTPQIPKPPQQSPPQPSQQFPQSPQPPSQPPQPPSQPSQPPPSQPIQPSRPPPPPQQPPQKPPPSLPKQSPSQSPQQTPPATSTQSSPILFSSPQPSEAPSELAPTPPTTNLQTPPTILITPQLQPLSPAANPDAGTSSKKRNDLLKTPPTVENSPLGERKPPSQPEEKNLDGGQGRSSPKENIPSQPDEKPIELPEQIPSGSTPAEIPSGPEEPKKPLEPLEPISIIEENPATKSPEVPSNANEPLEAPPQVKREADEPLVRKEEPPAPPKERDSGLKRIFVWEDHLSFDGRCISYVKDLVAKPISDPLNPESELPSNINIEEEAEELIELTREIRRRVAITMNEGDLISHENYLKCVYLETHVVHPLLNMDAERVNDGKKLVATLSHFVRACEVSGVDLSLTPFSFVLDRCVETYFYALDSLPVKPEEGEGEGEAVEGAPANEGSKGASLPLSGEEKETDRETIMFVLAARAAKEKAPLSIVSVFRRIRKVFCDYVRLRFLVSCICVKDYSERNFWLSDSLVSRIIDFEERAYATELSYAKNSGTIENTFDYISSSYSLSSSADKASFYRHVFSNYKEKRDASRRTNFFHKGTKDNNRLDYVCFAVNSFMKERSTAVRMVEDYSSSRAGEKSQGDRSKEQALSKFYVGILYSTELFRCLWSLNEAFFGTMYYCFHGDERVDPYEYVYGGTKEEEAVSFMRNTHPAFPNGNSGRKEQFSKDSENPERNVTVPRYLFSPDDYANQANPGTMLLPNKDEMVYGYQVPDAYEFLMSKSSEFFEEGDDGRSLTGDIFFSKRTLLRDCTIVLAWFVGRWDYNAELGTDLGKKNAGPGAVIDVTPMSKLLKLAYSTVSTNFRLTQTRMATGAGPVSRSVFREREFSCAFAMVDSKKKFREDFMWRDLRGGWMKRGETFSKSELKGNDILKRIVDITSLDKREQVARVFGFSYNVSAFGILRGEKEAPSLLEKGVLAFYLTASGKNELSATYSFQSRGNPVWKQLTSSKTLSSVWEKERVDVSKPSYTTAPFGFVSSRYESEKANFSVGLRSDRYEPSRILPSRIGFFRNRKSSAFRGEKIVRPNAFDFEAERFENVSTMLYKIDPGWMSKWNIFPLPKKISWNVVQLYADGVTGRLRSRDSDEWGIAVWTFSKMLPTEDESPSFLLNVDRSSPSSHNARNNNGDRSGGFLNSRPTLREGIRGHALAKANEGGTYPFKTNGRNSRESLERFAVCSSSKVYLILDAFEKENPEMPFYAVLLHLTNEKTLQSLESSLPADFRSISSSEKEVLKDLLQKTKSLVFSTTEHYRRKSFLSQNADSFASDLELHETRNIYRMFEPREERVRGFYERYPSPPIEKGKTPTRFENLPPRQRCKVYSSYSEMFLTEYCLELTQQFDHKNRTISSEKVEETISVFDHIIRNYPNFLALFIYDRLRELEEQAENFPGISQKKKDDYVKNLSKEELSISRERPYYGVQGFDFSRAKRRISNYGTPDGGQSYEFAATFAYYGTVNLFASYFNDISDSASSLTRRMISKNEWNVVIEDGKSFLRGASYWTLYALKLTRKDIHNDVDLERSYFKDVNLMYSSQKFADRASLMADLGSSKHHIKEYGGGRGTGFSERSLSNPDYSEKVMGKTMFANGPHYEPYPSEGENKLQTDFALKRRKETIYCIGERSVRKEYDRYLQPFDGVYYVKAYVKDAVTSIYHRKSKEAGRIGKNLGMEKPKRDASESSRDKKVKLETEEEEEGEAEGEEVYVPLFLERENVFDSSYERFVLGELGDVRKKSDVESKKIDPGDFGDETRTREKTSPFAASPKDFSLTADWRAIDLCIEGTFCLRSVENAV